MSEATERGRGREIFENSCIKMAFLDTKFKLLGEDMCSGIDGRPIPYPPPPLFFLTLRSTGGAMAPLSYAIALEHEIYSVFQKKHLYL